MGFAVDAKDAGGGGQTDQAQKNENNPHPSIFTVQPKKPDGIDTSSIDPITLLPKVRPPFRPTPDAPQPLDLNQPMPTVGVMQVLFPATTAYLVRNPINGSPDAQIFYAINEANVDRALVAKAGGVISTSFVPLNFFEKQGFKGVNFLGKELFKAAQPTQEETVSPAK